MPTRKSPRKGSLQYWPRKRATKFLPRVRWNSIKNSEEEKGLKGFIGYKAGMANAFVSDNTPDSMTKGKTISLPVTIIECPKLKIFSVRFYKNGQVDTEILGEGLDKELKKIIKLPKKSSSKKELEKLEEISKDYDDVTIICYSVVKNIGLKKKPDLSEIGLSGSMEEKTKFVKENLGKELSINDFFSKGEIVDVRGLTKGKGFSGPVKRFGITLKSHKSEKGVRRPGSIGPWHPARVTFRVPMAGQLGMFTRVIYNNKIIDMNNISESDYASVLKSLKNYGNVKSDYIIVKGSVQGSVKRQLLVTKPLRETKRTKKKNYELVELK